MMQVCQQLRKEFNHWYMSRNQVFVNMENVEKFVATVFPTSNPGASGELYGNFVVCTPDGSEFDYGDDIKGLIDLSMRAPKAKFTFQSVASWREKGDYSAEIEAHQRHSVLTEALFHHDKEHDWLVACPFLRTAVIAKVGLWHDNDGPWAGNGKYETRLGIVVKKCFTEAWMNRVLRQE